MKTNRMKHLLALLCFTIFLATIPGISDQIISPGSPGDLPQSLTGTGYAPGHVLVKTGILPDGTAGSLSQATEAIGATIEHDFGQEGLPGLLTISLPDTMTVTQGVAYYQQQPGVQYAEPDYFRYLYQAPTDPGFYRQWGLQNTGQVFKENTSPGTAGTDISAATAWNITTGEGRAIIAVIDTGVDYLHPDLSANIWTDPLTRTHGYDVISGTVDPMDWNGHGTHCAGIIGAVANNGIGGSGVLWNTTIMPVRFFSGMPVGWVSDEISAILWARQHGARLFSCSYGGKYPSYAEYDVINATDGLFMIAAGNKGQDTAVYPEYPATYNLSNIIAVASLEPNNTLSSFSNFGNNTVHLAAPGSNIFSTWLSSYQPEPFWYEPFDTLSNWSVQGSWRLDNSTFVSAPYSILGNTSGEQAILTISSPLNLTDCETPILSWYIKGEGTLGTIFIEGSNDGGISWGTINSRYISSTPEFILMHSQIPQEYHNRKILIRLRLEKTSCFLDDLMLSDGYGRPIEIYWAYNSGTSMAAPMVGGVAAMLMDAAPKATLPEIREAILSSTDPVPDLAGRTVTGGRVNLTAALLYLIKSEGIPLEPGWNHVSVYQRPAPGYDTAGIFAGVNSSGHSVLMYTNDTSGYVTLNATDLIAPLQGYWVYSANATTVPIIYAEPVTGAFREIPAGWSSIGGWAEEDLSANMTLSSLQTWSYAIGFNASSQQYDEPIVREGAGNQSDERPIKPYQGYWLYCTGNGTYQSGFG